MVPLSQLLEMQRQLKAMTAERDHYKRLSEWPERRPSPEKEAAHEGP